MMMSPAAPRKHLAAPPGVAAVVNGQRIPTSEVAALAVQFSGGDIAERLINNLLVEQAAKAAHVAASPGEVNARLAEVKVQIMQQQQAQRVPVRSLDALLLQSHETLANFKDSLRLRILAEKLVAPRLPVITLVHARHILVLTNSGASPGTKAHTDEDAQKLIGKAQDELKAGKSWDDVCKKYSEDPSNKDTGGDLHIIGTGMTQIDPTFLQAALSLKAGEITPAPVKSVFGYHLIKVDSTSAAPASAEEKVAYAAALQTARDAQFKQIIPAYIQALRAKGNVVNYLAQ